MHEIRIIAGYIKFVNIYEISDTTLGREDEREGNTANMYVSCRGGEWFYKDDEHTGLAL